MKLTLTDEFLWDLYKILEKGKEVLDILFLPLPTFKEAGFPELRELKKKYKKKEFKRNFSQFIYYLKKKGYIKVKTIKHKKAILLTQKGSEKILKIRLQKTDKKKRKDGKWQMIIFDIPETKRSLRDLLRELLYLLGYRMLQQSVWVCPYDVLKETEAIIQKLSLERYVKIFLIEEIEI